MLKGIAMPTFATAELKDQQADNRSSEKISKLEEMKLAGRSCPGVSQEIRVGKQCKKPARWRWCLICQRKDAPHYFRFRHHMADQWFPSLRMEKPKYIPPNAHICWDHFPDSDFELKGVGEQRVFLKGMAMPVFSSLKEKVEVAKSLPSASGRPAPVIEPAITKEEVDEELNSHQEPPQKVRFVENLKERVDEEPPVLVPAVSASVINCFRKSPKMKMNDIEQVFLRAIAREVGIDVFSVDTPSLFSSVYYYKSSFPNFLSHFSLDLPKIQSQLQVRQCAPGFELLEDHKVPLGSKCLVASCQYKTFFPTDKAKALIFKFLTTWKVQFSLLDALAKGLNEVFVSVGLKVTPISCHSNKLYLGLQRNIGSLGSNGTRFELEYMFSWVERPMVELNLTVEIQTLELKHIKIHNISDINEVLQQLREHCDHWESEKAALQSLIPPNNLLRQVFSQLVRSFTGIGYGQMQPKIGTLVHMSQFKNCLQSILRINEGLNVSALACIQLLKKAEQNWEASVIVEQYKFSIKFKPCELSYVQWQMMLHDREKKMLLATRFLPLRSLKDLEENYKNCFQLFLCFVRPNAAVVPSLMTSSSSESNHPQQTEGGFSVLFKDLISILMGRLKPDVWAQKSAVTWLELTSYEWKFEQLEQSLKTEDGGKVGLELEIQTWKMTASFGSYQIHLLLKPKDQIPRKAYWSLILLRGQEAKELEKLCSTTFAVLRNGLNLFLQNLERCVLTFFEEMRRIEPPKLSAKPELMTEIMVEVIKEEPQDGLETFIKKELSE